MMAPVSAGKDRSYLAGSPRPTSSSCAHSTIPPEPAPVRGRLARPHRARPCSGWPADPGPLTRVPGLPGRLVRPHHPGQGRQAGADHRPRQLAVAEAVAGYRSQPEAEFAFRQAQRPRRGVVLAHAPTGPTTTSAPTCSPASWPAQDRRSEIAYLMRYRVGQAKAQGHRKLRLGCPVEMP